MSAQLNNRVDAAGGICSFCGKPASASTLLIPGEGANICDLCVRQAVDRLRQQGAKQHRYTYELLDEHFRAAPPETIATSIRHFPARMRADLQKALEDCCLQHATRLVGIHKEYQHEDLKFSVLLERGRHAKPIAPLQHIEIDIGEGTMVRCLDNGLALLEVDNAPVAVLIAPHLDHMDGTRSASVEIAVPIGGHGAAIVDRLFKSLEQAVQSARSYRGKVLSLERRRSYSGAANGIAVHNLRPVSREDVILPQRTLDQIDHNIVRFAGLRDALRDAGMSTKKGLLFYGPPGTGKTHTIHYLAACLPHHTTLLVTAEQVGLLPEYFQLARLLQPSILVIEDVDLVARDRETMGSACEEVMLNMLLNEMDGLREDADIFFVLTTNRPEAIEAALAARPGRIDQAIEFPRPDEASRRKLVDLYGGRLPLSDALRTHIVRRTEGVTASFIKELMRRIAQAHIEAGSQEAVAPDQVDAALGEMLFTGGVLNAALLGGEVATARA